MRPNRPLPDFVRQQQLERRSALRQQLSDRLRAGPIVAEFGCGHGHFLAAYAEANPSQSCVGIDLVTHRIERANRKVEVKSLENLGFFKADANDFLECLPDGVGIERAFMLFPDPWPKKRHHKNRMLQLPFLERLAAVSLPDAEFLFRTDHDELFAWALDCIAASPHWILADDRPWPFENSSFFQELMDGWQSLIATRTMAV